MLESEPNRHPAPSAQVITGDKYRVRCMAVLAARGWFEIMYRSIRK